MQGNNMKERIKNYFKKSPWKIASDAIFWVLIILLLIPSTRSGFLSVVSKVRTAVFQPALKPQPGAVLGEAEKTWSLVDLEGNHSTLGDFDGEVILINFWATWCPPCRAEMPSLDKLYADYGSKMQFLLVSNEEMETIEQYITQKNFSFPAWLNLSAPPQSLQTKSIPATFIINKEGRIVYNKTGAFDWNSKKVREFLDTLLSE
jgi:thiol-disulfide isomerase/thioredoxin